MLKEIKAKTYRAKRIEEMSRKKEEKWLQNLEAGKPTGWLSADLRNQGQVEVFSRENWTRKAHWKARLRLGLLN